MTLRVLLVDDHRLLVEGLASLLKSHGIEVVGVAYDGFEGVAQARALKPDVALMDLRMPRCDGLCATRLISTELPEVKVVVLTTSAEDADLFEAIKSGAYGYLIKSLSGDEFVAALAGVAQGTPPFSPGLAAKLLREFARLGNEGRAAAPVSEQAAASSAGLTERQIEVLRLVAAGLTYKEAAARLFLSERTVRYHMAAIMEQLRMQHRSEVLAFAGRMGLVPPKET
jgi:two-component system NarL family response regulator